MTNIKELLEKAKQRKGVTLAVPCCEDDHVLHAVDEARRMGIGSFILVGDKAATNEIAEKENIDISNYSFLDISDKSEACYAAAKLVSDGEAGGLMKGLVDTSVVLKAVLSKELNLRTGRRFSHFAVFAVPNYHKLLFVTDAAINISPDIDCFRDIIQNSVEAVRVLGIDKPKVALLAAKEKPDPKMPVTLVYQEILDNPNGLLDNAYIAGPLALDNAVSKESAITKGIYNEVAGDADILVCPNLESGNILYKSLSFLNTTENGGMILGCKAPVVMTSRADSARAKLISIALAILETGGF